MAGGVGGKSLFRSRSLLQRWSAEFTLAGMGSHFGSSSHAISGIDIGWPGNAGDVGAMGPRGLKSLAGTRKGAQFLEALWRCKSPAAGLARGVGSGYVPFSSGCLAGDQCAKDG